MHAAGRINITDANATPQLAKSGRCVLAAVRAWQAGLDADAYVQLFDKSAVSQVTLGTTVPDWVVLVDFGSGEVSGGDGLPTDGIVFQNGIVVASTTTAGGSTVKTTQVRLAVL